MSYILIAYILVGIEFTVAQQLCAKIDFDRAFYSEYRECKEQRLPALYIKDYASDPEVPLYRRNSTFFLSNDFYGFSCIESNIVLTFNQFTSIETAIYLRSTENSFVEVNVYDATINARMNSFRRSGTPNASWYILRGKVDTNISNARVSLSIEKVNKLELREYEIHYNLPIILSTNAS